MVEHEEPFILTSVQVACRDLEGVPYIVHLIHQFTENISQVALLNMLKDKQLHLLPKVLHAVDESLNMLYEEKLQQYRLAMYLVPDNMTLKEGKLNVMKELYKRYPGVVDETTVRYIVHALELPVLKWLYKNNPMVFKRFKFCAGTIFANASMKGVDNVVHWIVKLFPNTVRSLVYAIRGGHHEQLKWLMKHTKWDENSLGVVWCEAIKSGHLDIAKFLYEMKPPKISLWYLKVESLAMLQWIHDINRWDFGCSVVIDAAREGRLEMLQWMYIHHPKLFNNHAMDRAATNGHLEVVKFLHYNCKKGCTTAAMNLAAENWHLEVVQWLHENRTEGCTAAAMNLAAKNNLLEIVQWLHNNRTEGCTTEAMDSAANKGHWGILKWLHANRNEGCTLNAMGSSNLYVIKWLHENFGQTLPKNFVDTLARAGNVEILTWMHSSRKGIWFKETMNEAAANGHLSIVKFLHENRREGCTKAAMDKAAKNNHFEVVKWLHANRREGCTKAAMNAAAGNGNFEMVQWLQANRREGCPTAAMSAAATGGHLKIMKFLDAKYALPWNSQPMTKAVANGHTEIVKWLYYHLKHSVKSTFAIQAARNGDIGVLEFLDTETNFCSNTSVYFVGVGNKNPEVAEWYKNRYGNPRKRKW